MADDRISDVDLVHVDIDDVFGHDDIARMEGIIQGIAFTEDEDQVHVIMAKDMANYRRGEDGGVDARDDHDFLIDRLIIPACIVQIEIHVKVVHVLNKRKRIEHVNIIYIESMLRELKSTLSKELGPVNNRVHKKVMSLWSSLYILPGKELFNGEH